MSSLFREFVRVATAGVLAVVFLIPQDALADSHVVSLAELQSAAVASTRGEHRDRPAVYFLAQGRESAEVGTS